MLPSSHWWKNRVGNFITRPSLGLEVEDCSQSPEVGP